MSLVRIAKLAGPLLAGLLLVSASAAPSAVLVFVDDESQLTLSDAQGKSLTVSEGLVVGAGTTVRTKQTTVEFRLEPNGSILKLAPHTTFRIKTLQGSGSGSNDFGLEIGRMRVVAAKLSGAVNYHVKTPTAQAGVRGTDFVLEANPKIGDWICVKEGAVEFGRDQGPPGQPKAILVKAGEFANAKAPDFKPKAATAEDIAKRFEGLDFQGAKESDVPGHTAP